MDLLEIYSNNMKSIFQSKVFWLAVVQGIAGVLVVVVAQYPDVGALIILKSIVDIVLRYLTVVPIA